MDEKNRAHARLILVQGTCKGVKFLLDKPFVILGRRSSESNICLPCQKISRMHAEIQVHGDQVSIQDLGSLNGTFLNGKRIPAKLPIAMSHGDIIQLGEVSLKFLPAGEIEAE